MESKKINQLATELAPDLSDLTIIGDPTTGISKKITLSQMASLFTGTVEEYANFAAFPLVGVADTIYIALDTNILYRWNTGTSAYVELSPNIVSSLVFNDANGFDGTINLVGSVATLTITTALTTGSVGFIGASGALLQDNTNFFWDDTNNRLGLGTNAPTTALDVFGSGIIGRINGTSTNNAFLGFSSAGTNKWSIGNVQSDHRFRIYNEATTSELVSVLSTGEFGIGIANPLTKFHIDGGATALIANLDANVSVSKTLSFRSDNSNRINLEVSGTESGSNAGADFFIRRYSDAGSLIDTPLTITRSTGGATFSGILTTPQVKAATSAGLSINANSGTQVADFGAGGSANMTLFGGLSGTSASFSSTATATAFIPSGATIPTNGMYLSAANTLNFATNTTNRLTISSTGAATFSSPNAVIANNQGIRIYSNDALGTDIGGGISFGGNYIGTTTADFANIKSGKDNSTSGNYAGYLAISTNAQATGNVERMRITSVGNVGIGTSSPNSKLEILVANSATNQSGMEISNAANASLKVQLRTNITELIAGGTGNMVFSNDANERMRITSDGYVLIGTTTSSGLGVSRFQLASTSTTGQILITNTSGGYASTYSTSSDIYMGRIDNGSSTLYIGTGPLNGASFNNQLSISGSGAVTIPGSLSKGSGSFRIEHPLESLSETHQLVHSFIEGPQADLIYRGKITLINGKAQANIDQVSTMTEGTFQALCREVQCFTTNETGWDLIKGKVIGNIIYIESQNIKSTDEISWLVIGERKDKHIMNTDWTDENGKVIVEPLKPIKKEEAIIKEENPIIEEEKIIIEEKEVILEPKTI